MQSERGIRVQSAALREGIIRMKSECNQAQSSIIRSHLEDGFGRPADGHRASPHKPTAFPFGKPPQSWEGISGGCQVNREHLYLRRGGSEAFTGGGSEAFTVGGVGGIQRPSEALGGAWRPSEAIGGARRNLEAIRGHQRPSHLLTLSRRWQVAAQVHVSPQVQHVHRASVVASEHVDPEHRRNQRHSEALRGTQGQSEAIRCNQRQ